MRLSSELSQHATCARVVRRVVGRRVREERLPLRRVRERLRARRRVDRDDAVVRVRRGEVREHVRERADLHVVRARRHAALRLVVDRLRAVERVRARDGLVARPGKPEVEVEHDVVRRDVLAGLRVDRLRADRRRERALRGAAVDRRQRGREVVRERAGRARGVAGRRRGSRSEARDRGARAVGELLHAVVAVEHLAGLRVDELAVAGERRRLRVDDERLVRGPHALRVGRQRRQPHALVRRRSRRP